MLTQEGGPQIRFQPGEGGANSITSVPPTPAQCRPCQEAPGGTPDCGRGCGPPGKLSQDGRTAGREGCKSNNGFVEFVANVLNMMLSRVQKENWEKFKKKKKKVSQRHSRKLSTGETKICQPASFQNIMCPLSQQSSSTTRLNAAYAPVTTTTRSQSHMNASWTPGHAPESTAARLLTANKQEKQRSCASSR